MSKNNQYYFVTLPNNLRVLYLPFKNTSSVCVSLIGKVGHRAERKNELGAAHFLEHLNFDGTQKRPTALEINKFLDEQGAQHNGFVHAETVEYFVKTLSEKAEICFDYLSDTFLNSSLKEIEKEKKVIAEEHATCLDRSGEIMSRRFLKMMYPNLNIGRSFEEEDQNIVNFDRDILLDFRKRNYVASNFVLTVAGNVAKGLTINLAKKYFSAVPSGKEIFFEKAQVEKERKIDIFHRDFRQSILMIGFRGYSARETKEFISSLFLHRILTSGFSSRLYDLLRSQLHLVYTVRSEVFSLSDAGDFAIQAKVNEKNLPKVAELILAETRKIVREGVSDAEVEKAKNMILSNFLFSLEKIENYAGYFSQQCFLRENMMGIEEYADIVRKITRKEVIKAASEIFSDLPKICVLTPKLNKLD